MIKINLLPPAEKKELRLESIANWLIFFFASLFVLLIIYSLLLGNSYLNLFIAIKTQTEVIAKQQENSEVQQVAELETQIKETNQRIRAIDSIQANFIYWTPIIQELILITPNQINLNSLYYKKDDNQLNLKGWAQSRDDLLEFKNAIEASPYFLDLESPLANLLKQNDIDFSFNFKLASSTLDL